MTDRAKKNQGMNWISQHKRLAIHLRDGLACAYCGESIEAGAQLTLDHLKPYSKGGCNKETNLVTACKRCNSARGNRSYITFADDVARYLDHGIEAENILRHIKNCRVRKLPLTEAKTMIDRRGSSKKVLEHVAQLMQ